MNLFISKSLSCLLGIFCLSFVTAAEIEPLSVSKIWDDAPHNAFTDLVRFDGKFYCTFREGTGHVPGTKGIDGTIRVLQSEQGTDWKSVALIAEAGVDLRDPKLSVTADNRLMLLIGGSYYDGNTIKKRQPRVCFMHQGDSSFSALSPLVIDESIRSNFDWLWRVTWHKDSAYGVMYQSNAQSKKFGLHLVRSNDGVNYEALHAFEIDGSPNEATLRFLADGRLAMMLRRESADKNGMIATAKAPFTQWTKQTLDHRLGGPNFVQLDNRSLIAGTRQYVGGVKTILARIDLHGNFTKLATLPSGGDTSYPGFVIHDNKLWMSYYASHEGKTSIYLAVFALEHLVK